MTSPEINVKFFEHEDNPLPEDGSVHVITTQDGIDLRLGLWPVPGFKISTVDTSDAPVPGEETPSAAGNGTTPEPPGDSPEEPDTGASPSGDEAGTQPADGENPSPEMAAAPDADQQADEKPAISEDVEAETPEQPAPGGTLSDDGGKAASTASPDEANPEAAEATGADKAAHEAGNAVEPNEDDAKQKETLQDRPDGEADAEASPATDGVAPPIVDGAGASGMDAMPDPAPGPDAIPGPDTTPGPDVTPASGTESADGAPGEDEGESKAAVQPDPDDKKTIASASPEAVIAADNSEGVGGKQDALTGTSGKQGPEADSEPESSVADGKDTAVDAPPAPGHSMPAETHDSQTEALGTPSSAETPQPALPLEQAITMSGTIIVLNGRSEFIEKYAEVIRELIDRGFCVAALDWRGQGGSERLIKGRPLKGHIDDMDSYVEDLTTLLDFLETTNCPKPYYCLAHSTGGQILLRAAPLISSRISRAVTTAPFLDLASYRTPKPLVYAFASTLTYSGLGEMYAPGAGRNPPSDDPFEGNDYSSDPRRYQRTADLVHRHKELAIGGPTVSWMYAALKSADELFDPEFLASITLPILMLSASDDKVVSVQAVEDFAGMARTVSHLSIPGARHEILMERDEIRSQFWAAFDAFIPGED